MTTDPTPELCCEHGQQLIERAERLLDLLEDRHSDRPLPRRAHKPSEDAYLVAEFFSDGEQIGVWTSQNPGVTGPADLEQQNARLAMDPPVEIADGVRYYWATQK